MLFFIIAITVDFKITDVVIYSNSAKITRAGRISFELGDYTVMSNLIPGNIDDKSIRLKATPGIHLGEVSVVRVYSDTVFKQEIKTLEDSIDMIQGEIDYETKKLDALKAQEEFVNSIKVTMPQKYSQELYSGKSSTIQWSKTLKFIYSELQKIYRERQNVENHIKELKDILLRLKKRLYWYKSSTTFHRIEFPVHVKKTGSYRFTLEYIVNDAQWNVHYIVRATPEKGKITIEYYGDIVQNTGEDWKNVNLTLSTRATRYTTTAPHPDIWFIYPHSTTEEAEKMEKLKTPGVAIMRGKPIFSSTIETSISIVYSLVGKRTIKSGKTPTSVLIKSAEFDGDFYYFAYPRGKQAAFLKAEVVNTTNNLYLPGRASIFVGPEFVGEGMIGHFSPGEKISISCGVDNRIKVERELIRKFFDKGGVFSKKKKVAYRFRNLIRNGLDREIDVNFIDCIPVPRVSDITVKDVFFSAKPDSINKDKGLAYWHLKIPSHETFVETTGFKIEYPKDKEVWLPY